MYTNTVHGLMSIGCWPEALVDIDAYATFEFEQGHHVGGPHVWKATCLQKMGRLDEAAIHF